MPTDRRLCCFRPLVSVACGGGPNSPSAQSPGPQPSKGLWLAASRALTIFPQGLGREPPGSEGPWALLPGPRGLEESPHGGARAWLRVLVGSEPSQAQGVCGGGSLGQAGRELEPPALELEPPALELSPLPSHGRLQRGARRAQTQGLPPASAPQILPARLGVRPGGNPVALVKPSHLQREGVPSAPHPQLSTASPTRVAASRTRGQEGPASSGGAAAHSGPLCAPSAHEVIEIMEQPPDSGTAPLPGPRRGGQASRERARLCCLLPVSPRALEGGENYSSEPAWGGVS